MLLPIIRKVVPGNIRPIRYLAHLTRKNTKLRVRSGPFKEMRYVENSVGSAYIPKLLGIYERELASQVEEICAQAPGLIVDIGAAEGYYAIGLATRNPGAQVIAFEMEEAGRLLLSEMARLNQVANRVEIRGRCEPQDLQHVLAGKSDPVIICDVEGYEEALLDPSVIPDLQRATILVEMHDMVIPGITEKLQARFAFTHQVSRIDQEARSRAEFPWTTLGTLLLPNSYIDWAVSEWRPQQMSWLWMKPRGKLRQCGK